MVERAPISDQSLELDTLGYASADVIGHSFEEFLTPVSSKRFRHSFPALLETGEARDVLFELVWKDGAVILTRFESRVDIRVIVSSGYDQYEVMRDFEGEPLISFLQKPYEFSRLTAGLRTMLDPWPVADTP